MLISVFEICRYAPIVFNQGKKLFFKQLYLANLVTEVPKLKEYLGAFNYKPFFEQVTSSRSSGKSLGADLPPPLPGS